MSLLKTTDILRLLIVFCGLGLRVYGQNSGATQEKTGNNPVIVTVYDDGDRFLCPNNPRAPDYVCNLRRAIEYMVGENGIAQEVLPRGAWPRCPEECPSPQYGYVEIRTTKPYKWNYARAVRIINKTLTIQSKPPPAGTVPGNNHRSVIEGYLDSSWEKDYDYIDAGFLYVGIGGKVKLQMIEFRNFHRMAVPRIFLNMYIVPFTTVTRGGVIHVDGGALQAMYCVFFNNTAHYGGALHIDSNQYFESNALISSGCMFEQNYAMQNGGAVNVNSEFPTNVVVGTFRQGDFECPIERWQVGAKPTTSDQVLTIEKLADCGVAFFNNKAKYHGGGISFWHTNAVGRDRDTRLTVNEFSTFTKNRATVDGGAIYIHNIKTLDLGGEVKFKGNEAKFGAALYLHTIRQVNFGQGVEFSENAAKECGGSLYFNIAGAKYSVSPGVNLQGFVRTAGNSGRNTAGNKYTGGGHGGCLGAFMFDDGSYGQKNCTEGLNCSKWGYPETGFPIKLQMSIDEAKEQYNCSIFNDLIGKDRNCEVDCLQYPEHPSCVDKVDQCVSDPCLNGAECQDRKYDYRCVCIPGWTGRNCEIDIDDCTNHYCQNMATCIDGPAPNANRSFSCECAFGWIGDYCQNVDYDALDTSITMFSRQQWWTLYVLVSTILYSIF